MKGGTVILTGPALPGVAVKRSAVWWRALPCPAVPYRAVRLSERCGAVRCRAKLS